MILQNNRQLNISTAGNRKAILWKQETVYWSELITRFQTPVKSTETLAQYLAMPKPKQDELKDVGGFVGGTLKDNRRKANNILTRDIVTLDFDNIHANGTDDVLRRVEGLGCGYAVYSTRKHSPYKPRLRVIIPLDRSCTADEYEPIARKIAFLIGIELCDPSTFEASRLMYYPSCCCDSVYVCTYSDKPFVSADGILATYSNWHNITEWAVVPGTAQAHIKLAAKQGDPLAKGGVVGAFCKTYDIHSVINIFLSQAYTPCDDGTDRYTFTGGSTAGGAVVYNDGAFLYSHHATDPAGGKLSNAFDLVRLHRFGELDDDAKPDTPSNRMPSYVAMCELALSDKQVATLIQQERYQEAVSEFTDIPDETANWISKLSVNKQTGVVSKTVDNILILLENDPLLKGKLAFDEFANRGLALGVLPWDGRAERRQWTDTDDCGLRHYIEKVYNITGKDRTNDATALCAFKHRINDVRDYLTSLRWDGVKRLDTLLIDYLGAKDTLYVRAVIRKSLCAAVARAMTPGCKYDYMPILAGPQGIGKSTFLRLLGRRWFSDSLGTFEGKEASEMIQGTWLNEIGELNGMNRSETNAIKHFLSRTEDIYREPYGRRTASYPRRCVFFGTTNDKEFLRDATGNRRFLPVDVGLNAPSKSVFKDLIAEIDPIWAEAFCLWQLGEPLYLTGDEEQQALQEQESHKENNAKEGLIREFLNKEVPIGWDMRDATSRRAYWSNEFNTVVPVETVARERVCAVEVWVELFGSETRYMKQSDTREINAIIGRIEGWEPTGHTARFGCYGVQRGFKKRV
jgi:predicted P-loop ATPase